MTVSRINAGIRIEINDHELVIQRGPVSDQIDVSVFSAGSVTKFSISEKVWAFAMGALIADLGINLHSGDLA